MEKKIIEKYIADDGEVFDTLDECLSYEDMLGLSVGDHIKMLNSKFELITGVDNLEKVYYLRIDTTEKLKQFIAASNYYGITGIPDNTGYFEYNETLDKWVNIDSEVERLLGIKEELM